MRSAIFDSVMRPVVIVVLDPTSDAGPRFFHAPNFPSRLPLPSSCDGTARFGCSTWRDDRPSAGACSQFAPAPEVPWLKGFEPPTSGVTGSLSV